MAPISHLPAPILALSLSAATLGFFGLVTGICLYQRHRWTRHSASLSTVHEPPSALHHKRDESTPLLSADLIESNEASTTRTVSAPRSGDLAFALTLPRPSLHAHVHEHNPSPSTAATQPRSAAETSTPAESEEPEDQEEPVVVEPIEEPRRPEPDDGGAVSARGRTCIEVSAHEGRAVRRTDIVARHPRFRRRVRTWDTAALLPAQDTPQNPIMIPVAALQNVENTAQLGLERTETW